MATIKIRRGSGQPAIGGSGLTAYEPAWDTVNNRFFINNGSTAMWIGAAVIQDTTLSGNCAWTIPTQNSVKTYVDNQVSAGAVSSINGATGAVTIGGGTGISIATSTAARGITIGVNSSVALLNLAQTFTSTKFFTGGLTSTTDIYVNNLTVGRGGGSISGNVAVGQSALLSNTTGIQNTAVGGGALSLNTDGYENTALGNGALLSNTSGQDNTAVGDSALNANQTSHLNTAIGSSSLAIFTSGEQNSAFGNSSLGSLVSGSFNTALGRWAGTASTSSTGGVFIGYNSRSNSTSVSNNEIVIGANAVGFGSNTAVIGATAQSAAYIYGLVHAMSGVSAPGATFSGAVNFLSNITAPNLVTSVDGVTGAVDLLAGSGISITVPTGTAKGITLTNIGVIGLTGTANQVAVSGTSGSVTLSLPSTIVAPGSLSVTGLLNPTAGISANGGMTLAGSLQAAAATFGGLVTANSGLVVTGGVTFNSNIYAPNLVSSVDGVTGAVDLLAGSGISITVPTGAAKGITLTNIGVVGITGTANQVSVSGTSGSVTLSLPSAITTPGSLTTTTSLLVGTDATISGNLTVNGTTTTVNSTTVTVQDPIIAIGGITGNGRPVAGDVKDRGILFQYNTAGGGATGATGFFGLDQSSGVFTFIPISSQLTPDIITGTAGIAEFSQIRNVTALDLLAYGTGNALISLAGNTAATSTSITNSAYETLITNSTGTGRLSIANSGFKGVFSPNTYTSNRDYSLPNLTGQVVVAATSPLERRILVGDVSGSPPYWADPTSSGFTAFAATNADNLRLVASNSNTNFNLTFAQGNSGYQIFYADTANNLTWNPSTGTLTLANGRGFLEGVIEGGTF